MKSINRKFRAGISLLCALAASLAIAAARAEDWPNFRGINHDGNSTEKVTAAWPLQVLWTADVGAGFSETVVSGGRLYTWGWSNNTTTVYCMNPATGEKIWVQSNPFHPNRDTHEAQCSTLSVNDGKIYAMDREANLYCYDAMKGTELWHRDINKEVGFQCYQAERGESGSPVIEGNLVLFCFGTGGTALDKNTGAKVWCNGTAGTSFSSAFVYSAGNSRIATFIHSTVATSNNTHGGVGVEVPSGRKVWEFDLGDYGNFTCADLMIAGDKVIYTAGYYGASISRAYTLGTGKLSQAWNTGVIGNRCTCNVLYNNLVYGCDGNTQDLVCMDAQTGAQKWRQKGAKSKFDEHAGVIVAGGQLIIVAYSNERGDKGDLLLVEASPAGYKEVQSQPGVIANRGSYNVFRPSIADGRLFIRNSNGDIVCLKAGVPGAAAAAAAAAAQEKSKPAVEKPVVKALAKPDDKILAEWNGKLKQRLKDELAAGRHPAFAFASMRAAVTVDSFDSTGNLSFKVAQGGSFGSSWAQLTSADLAALAPAVARKDAPEDHALAAFFLLADGQRDKASGQLSEAGALAQAVREIFRGAESTTGLSATGSDVAASANHRETSLAATGGAGAGSLPVARDTKELTVDLGNNVTMQFILIPAGSCTVGSKDEPGKPHKVTITKPFYLGKYEVTQEQWQAVMGDNPSMFKGEKRPVDRVSWNDSQDFLAKLNQKLNGRKASLPTEGQWEYAAKAGTTTAYTTGDGVGALKEAGWFNENSGNETHPVGEKKPNAWGLYDMNGNVWEWSSDWFADYPGSDAIDPTGPKEGATKVIRGGSWHNSDRHSRTAFRDGSKPENKFQNFGMRVLVEAGGK